MRRTQIYLEDIHYQTLRKMARREDKTIAALIRESLERFLNPKPQKKDPFGAVIGIGKGDGVAVAENVDDYLYGSKP